MNSLYSKARILKLSFLKFVPLILYFGSMETLYFPLSGFRLCIFAKNIKEVLLYSSLHHVIWHMTSVCPITDNVGRRIF